jgi:hypothetical protein
MLFIEANLNIPSISKSKIPKERFVLIFEFRYWSLFRPGLCPGNPASPVGAYLEFSA